MAEVSIRDLRNHGGEVVERARRGERLIVTRAGEPVAEITGLRRPAVALDVLIERWRRLPAVEPDRLRADIDSVLDAGL